MIANVAPRKGGSAEKKYKITVSPTSKVSFVVSPPASALSGDFVKFLINESTPLQGIHTVNSLRTVPTEYTTSEPLTRAVARNYWYYFVMPAEDVIIS